MKEDGDINADLNINLKVMTHNDVDVIYLKINRITFYTYNRMQYILGIEAGNRWEVLHCRAVY